MRCSYCHREISKGRGRMFIKTDGSRFTFCNSKCEKHWEKGRRLEYVAQKQPV